MARMRTQMTPQMSRVLEILKTERVHLNAEEILQQVDVSRVAWNMCAEKPGG